MKLQLFSDIHLELSAKGCSLLKRLVPHTFQDSVLILAGDIGNPCSKLYKLFVTEMAAKYLQVFIVLGNHEYYQPLKRVYDRKLNKLTGKFRLSMDTVETELQTFAATLPNVHVLQMGTFVYQRVRFLGCTLWSPGSAQLAGMMNDYSQIGGFSASISSELHTTHSAWLRVQLAMTSTEYDHTVIITHHLPSYALIDDRYKEESTNVFYASHLDDLVMQADVWVCGHAHVARQVTIGKCRCYLNPIGYATEITGWNKDLTITI